MGKYDTTSLSRKHREVEAMHEKHKQKYMQCGRATIVYGKHKVSGREGWFFPGFRFTTDVYQAQLWCEELNNLMAVYKPIFINEVCDV